MNVRCGAHGTCTNTTANASAAPAPAALCVCDDGWTGRNDFVDFAGRACHLPAAWVHGLWTLAAALGVSVTSVGAVLLRW